MSVLEKLEHGSGSSEKQSTTGSFTDEKHPSDSTEFIHGDISTFDVGMKLAAKLGDDPELSPQESARLRRKIDWHLLPLLCLIYTGKLFNLHTLEIHLYLIYCTIHQLVQFIDK